MESGKESGVDGQRFAIGGRLVDADDPQLQDLLAQAYEAPGRPRCLCVAGGVEMYVAFHRHFQIKRMPETEQGKQQRTLKPFTEHGGADRSHKHEKIDFEFSFQRIHFEVFSFSF